ncbi:MAG: SulP family inorganic anion transporter [Actinobacteria bacterium]|nr:SulP family inorganic anion transporter [Actinomycetota bacterium]
MYEKVPGNGQNEKFYNRYLPITGWFPDYERKWLPRDIVAGFTVWALLVPGALAFAEIAGVPVQYGLYAAPLAMIAYAVFGTSRRLFVGPSSTIAAVSAAVVAPLVLNGDKEKYIAMTIVLALVAGVILIAGGIARLGFLARFFAEPVLDGFIAGLAVFIIIGQLNKMLGVEMSGGNSLTKLIDLFRQFPNWSWITLTVGAGCLLLLFLFSRFAPKVVPGALIVLVLAMFLSTVFSLGEHGVILVGRLPAGLPSWSMKGIGVDELFELLPGAFGLVVVIFAQSIAIAKSYAYKHRTRVDPNQEMISYGMANIGAGIFQGYAVGGSLTKTAVNDEAGARTPLSMITCAVLTILTMLFLTPLFRNLPFAVLAAVVVQAVAGTVNWKVILRYYRINRADFTMAAAAFLGVLLLGILEGILIGILLSIAAFVYRTSKPHSVVLGVDKSGHRFGGLDEHEGYTCPLADAVIYRFDAPLIFANIELFSEEVSKLALESEPRPKAIIIDCELMYEMDTTAVNGFSDLYARLKEEDIGIILARVHTPVKLFLWQSGFLETLGEENVLPKILDAVDAFRRRNPECN